ncbi:hypothetical protein [Azohydromonas lata]|uniref:Uncharacterized protein n=1 Tax=Azohydromonas lata TaxID=45677 RepID=A0ABU5IAK7_9BURK|nr:hypothetical protein [Azohydromonas lata]MDZ5456132.1 hypothetical protein [Azohydromonas lata]
MLNLNRRQAMSTLSALMLAGCGGGEDSGLDLSMPTSGTTAAPLATEQAKEVAGNTPAQTPQAPPQFLLWDAGSGPSRDFWSRHLALPWKHRNTGDWLDAQGLPQGDVPWASFPVSGQPRVYEVDITALVRHWVDSGENRGAFLRGSGTTGSAYAIWSGRESEVPPQLLVTTDQGSFNCAGMLCGFDPSTYRSPDTRQSATHKPSAPVMVQFDLSAVQGSVQSALMRLNCLQANYVFTVKVFEVDAPRFNLGTDGQAPRMGLAAQGEAALKSHPSVLRCGDFGNLARGAVFDEVLTDSRNPCQQLPDPDAPGTTMLRGQFVPQTHASFHAVTQLLRGDAADPLRPALPATYDELYCRLYFMLEDDWNSTADVHKIALGWDLRMGWWNDYAGGYWYSITGNGGRRGSGKKHFWPAGSSGGVQLADRWGYDGHSVRLCAGIDPGDGNPYSRLRPLQDYVYSLDQPSDYGVIERLGSAAIAKGRWHCVEQRIKINSVTGPYDELGNGESVPDGELDTWLDGVLVSERRGLRWRCHPEMALRGPWINWYFGGRALPDMTMHYRMNHFVLATEYIGPRVG